MQAKIEFTTRCNLNCMHCSAAGYRPAPDWETDQLMSVLNQLIAEGYDEFHLQGGEPFIREDIFEILDLLEQNNVASVISTNSLLLNEEKIKKLLTYKGLAMLTFSLDGATEEIHNTMRGENAFNHTLKMIQHAVTLRSELQSMTTVGLNYTLTKVNYHEIGDVFRLADKLKVDSVSVLSLSVRGNALTHKDQLFLSEKDEFRALQKGATTLRKVNVGRQIKGVPPLIFNVELYPFTWKCKLMNQSRHLVSYVDQHLCSAGTHTIYITTDGTIYPCEAARPHLDTLEEILGPYERPTIHEYTIAEAKQTESFKKIVNFLQNYDQVFSSITPCNRCAHLGKCTICPLVVLEEGKAERCTEEVLSST
ncbi:MAG: radical SAM protein [Theionarchaea archaeon]|nr:radical SAM protein [Theionarchaea archaeon]